MTFRPDARCFKLYLDAPSSSASPDGDVSALGTHLEALEGLLLRHFVRPQGSRAEYKMHLCVALARLPVPDAVKVAKFHAMVVPSNGPIDERSAGHVLAFMAKEQPHFLGRLVKDDTTLLLRFFRRTDMARQWFNRFEKCAKHGIRTKGGAEALRHYLFANRETEWDKIVWEGDTHYAPPSVAARPQLLTQMDAVRTAYTLLDDPKFLASAPFQTAVGEGSLVTLDPSFFIDALLDDLREESPTDGRVLAAIVAFLRGCPFPDLLMALYPSLSDDQLLGLATDLLPSDAAPPTPTGAWSWETLVLLRGHWRTLDELLLYHALATTGLRDALADEDLPAALDPLLAAYNRHASASDQDADARAFEDLRRRWGRRDLTTHEIRSHLLLGFRLRYCLRVHLSDDESLVSLIRAHRLPFAAAPDAVDLTFEGSGEESAEEAARIKESRRAHKRERKRHRRSTKTNKKKKKRRRHKGSESASSSSTQSSGDEAATDDPEDPLARRTGAPTGPTLTWRVTPTSAPSDGLRGFLLSLTGGLAVASAAVPGLLADLFLADALSQLQRRAVASEPHPTDGRRHLARRRHEGLRMDDAPTAAPRRPSADAHAPHDNSGDGVREWDRGKEEEEWSSGSERPRPPAWRGGIDVQ